MKKILLAIFVSFPAFSFAAGAAPVVLTSAHTKDVPYVAQIEVTQKTAWEGTEIVRAEDGTCQQVIQSGLVLYVFTSPNGTIQAPSVKREVMTVKCPS